MHFIIRLRKVIAHSEGIESIVCPEHKTSSVFAMQQWRNQGVDFGRGGGGGGGANIDSKYENPRRVRGDWIPRIPRTAFLTSYLQKNHNHEKLYSIIPCSHILHASFSAWILTSHQNSCEDHWEGGRAPSPFPSHFVLGYVTAMQIQTLHFYSFLDPQ